MPASTDFPCDLDPLSPRESGPCSQLVNRAALRQVLSSGYGQDEADLYL